VYDLAMSEIRRATPADAAAIADIYNAYVENTVITFEVEPVSRAEMARRIESALAKHDWLVSERAGEIAGYAYANRFRERAAYRFVAESTIYLRDGLQGQGLGSPLYRMLIERIFALGYTSLVGVIALPNAASVRLHESLGFERTEHLRRVGWKHGRWIDVGSWQLESKPLAAAPLREPGPSADRS
jgi:L-amino acid N-acyltransferase YncA